jgi:nucleoside-diphosphate-sugar epimerase
VDGAGERTIYDSEWMRLALVDVELPSGSRFEHHVLRMPAQAAGVVVDDPDRGVLLLWRHRFINDPTAPVSVTTSTSSISLVDTLRRCVISPRHRESTPGTWARDAERRCSRDRRGRAGRRPSDPRRVVGRRPADQPVSFADVSKAERELGWRAERTIDNMCVDHWQWQRTHLDGVPR